MTLPKLGRYELIRVLGKGAMGLVYEARDPNLERRVALKTIKVDSLSPDDAAEYEVRFRVEAQSAARLQHPNIVSVYDSDRDRDVAFLVMEFVQGEDLKHHLDHGRQYTLAQTLGIMADLLSALDYAHRQSIVHRDIKPANLLIEPGGKVKLTDFGVARMQDSGDVTKTRGAMVGTLKYMSPEQVKGQRVDARADLFSAGIVLHQLLTGKRPFDGETDFAVIQQIIRNNPAAPSYFNPELPPALDAVVAKALAKSRDERFATAQEFAEALKLAGQQAGDPRVMPPPTALDKGSTGSTWSATVRSGESFLGTDLGRPTAVPSGIATVTQEIELVYWKDIKDSVDAQEIHEFLERFPSGIYADLARRRLKKLSGAPVDFTNTGFATPPFTAAPQVQSVAPIAPAAAATSAPADHQASTLAELTTGDVAVVQAHAQSLAEAEKIRNTVTASKKHPATGAASYAAPESAAAARERRDDAKTSGKERINNAAKENVADSSEKAVRETPKDQQRIRRTMTDGSGDSENGQDPTNLRKPSSPSIRGVLAVGLLVLTGVVFAVWPAAQTYTAPAILAPGPDAAVAATSAVQPSATVSDTPTVVSNPAQEAATAVMPGVPAASATITASTDKPDKVKSGARQASTKTAKFGQSAAVRALAEKAENVQVGAAQADDKPLTVAAGVPGAPTQPASAASSGSTSPGKICEARVLIAYQFCMAEQCAKPAFTKNSVCVERRNLERRNSEMNQFRN